MNLVNSKRVQLKASYVQTELTDDEHDRLRSEPGRALDKLNLVRSIAVTGSEARVLRERLPDDHELLDVVDSITDRREDQLALARRMAQVDVGALERLGDAIGMLRNTPAAAAVVSAFVRRIRVAPVGRLHLERIEMFPAGTEKGEMMFTVPMTPMETVTVSHKEWSTTKDEYERIVSDYFENYSERGVVDKTDASISTENESRHSSAFNFGSSVSGGYGPVTASVSVGLNSSSENRSAVKESMQNSREVTEKASARTRQEHKVSMKLEAVRGTEDASYRTIHNPHADKALRVDYFRMMRKWHFELYRYGLRLTFDIAVPNPGQRLWARYRSLGDLDTQLRQPFAFVLTENEITDTNWQDLATKFGVALPAPPAPTLTVSYSHRFEGNKEADGPIEFVAPEGYTMKSEFEGSLVYWGPSGVPLLLWGGPGVTMTLDQPTSGTGVARLTGKGVSAGNKLSVPFMKTAEYAMQLALAAGALRTDRTLRDWQHEVWNTIRDSEFAKFQARQALLQERRDRLWVSLNGSDTLTLRRLERDELMRGVLTWLLGPDFETAPEDVSRIIKAAMDRDSDARDRPDNQTQPTRSLSPSEWTTVSSFGELVKFIHHAVEWENLLYFLYPYFWGSDDLSREKLLFDHPDPGHRDFLRSGYARVVVPIRPGFEEPFTQLLDTGSPTGTSPYLTIAEEVAAFAHTNYGGIPPANPERHSRPLLYPQQRATWDTMQTIIGELDAFHKANGRMPATLAELPNAPYTDSWGNEFEYTMPGSGNDYDLISLGAGGAVGGEGTEADISAAAGASLMAMWFDYTPTSGIDIEVHAIPI